MRSTISKKFLQELAKFIVKASKKGYASDSTVVIEEPDGSKSVYFEEGDWKYHDNWFGGEPYGGRTVIFHKGKAVWMMLYQGMIFPWVKISPEKIYVFLRKTLQLITEERPYRGPERYVQDGLAYLSDLEGDVEAFKGTENIVNSSFRHEKMYYAANFMGGLLNLDPEK